MGTRKRTKTPSSSTPRPQPGQYAKTARSTLRSYEVGALPIIQHVLRRMRLPEILRQCLPADDSRTRLPTSQGLSVLLCNLLISREPIYGVGPSPMAIARTIVPI